MLVWINAWFSSLIIRTNRQKQLGETLNDGNSMEKYECTWIAYTKRRLTCNVYYTNIINISPYKGPINIQKNNQQPTIVYKIH